MTTSKHLNRTLTFSKRKLIEQLLESGISYPKIASFIECDKNTVYKERKRCKGKYTAEEAQLDADDKRKIKTSNAIFYRNRIQQKLHELEERIQQLENELKKIKQI